MNFESSETLPGQSGNVTRKGRCTYAHPASGEPFTCIEKKYGNNNLHQLHNAQSFLQFLSALAPEIVPRVYYTTRDTMYMEYISCATLRGYVQELDLSNHEDRNKFETAVSSVKQMLNKMSALRLCHTDLHADNIIMSGVDGAKIIDLDGMKLLSRGEDERCDDLVRLVMYLRAVGRASMTRAGPNNEAIVQFVDRVTDFDAFNPKRFHTRLGEADVGEMTASTDEFLLMN